MNFDFERSFGLHAGAWRRGEFLSLSALHGGNGGNKK